MTKYTNEDQKSFKEGEAYVTGRHGATVRIFLPDGSETALCTTTYSYNMSSSLKNIVAYRIAKLWNENRRR